MIPKFVINERALLIGRNLAIADLHIGLEQELSEAGIRIPSQTEKMLERIKNLIKKTKADRLVLLGDIKHETKGISLQEYDELTRFLEELSKKVKIDVVPGNHDGDIRKIVPAKVTIHEAKGFSMGNIYVCHGHAKPKEDVLECDYIIISHNHPAIEFIDKLGSRFVEPAWIKSAIHRKALAKSLSPKQKSDGDNDKVNTLELVIIPAFNRLVGGMPFNTLGKEELLGPIIRVMDLDKADAYLLDGTYLGKIRKLRG